MTGDGYEAAKEATAWTRLDAGVLSVKGDDAHGFLDRTVTAEVRDRPTRALLLDPDGKTQDSLHVLPRDNGFLVVSRRPEETAERWRSNIFVEDVTIEVTDDEVVSLQGPESAEAGGDLGTTAPPERRPTPSRRDVAGTAETAPFPRSADDAHASAV